MTERKPTDLDAWLARLVKREAHLRKRLRSTWYDGGRGGDELVKRLKIVASIICAIQAKRNGGER